MPGSFSFIGSFFDDPINLADDACTITTTTFTCAPLFSGGVFYVVEPSIAYDVTLPATTTVVVASATITGRADPKHSNDTVEHLDPPRRPGRRDLHAAHRGAQSDPVG